jgi:hypothetical protein
LYRSNGGSADETKPPKVTQMDHDDDLDLSTRLAALEARAPGPDRPPLLPGRRRRGRFALSIAMAPALALAVVATTAAGALVATRLAEGYPGIQNPGQPLAGAHMECMTPPEAAAFLAAHGFKDVDWQVESGTTVSAEGGKGASTSIHQAVPPEHGFVIPGSVQGNGQVIMVADQRTGATGVGDCFGHPMP